MLRVTIILSLFILFIGNVESMELNSDAFPSQGYIPTRYTCSGENISPPLFWDDVPEGTESFVLICEDPDAPVGVWDHWVIYNIPAEKRKLKENIPKTAVLKEGMLQGINDFGYLGYGGPCPPPGKPHRYIFKLFALDIKLSLSSGATKEAVVKSIKGHILAQAELMGLYGR